MDSNSTFSTVLAASSLNFSYGKQTVLHDLSFKVKRGSYTSIIGPNGSGKSTLFSLLWGGRSCHKGEIFYNNKALSSITVREKAKQFAVVHQNEINNFPFSCAELIILGLHPYRSRFGGLTAEQGSLIKEIMELTQTAFLADKLVTEISGGEWQRVLLARALVQKPQILFLDEAMSQLDISARITMTKLLRELVRQKGMTVIAVNHDLAMAYRYSDRIIALKQGEIAAQGIPAEVMTGAFFADVFGVKAEVLGDDGFIIQDSL